LRFSFSVVVRADHLDYASFLEHPLGEVLREAGISSLDPEQDS
jgi:hypothetical protein